MTPKSYLTLALCIFASHAVVADTHLQFQVEPQIITHNAPRLGLNLGEWVSWGSAQLPLNVLKNPGFEGIIDRAIVIVKEANELGFGDDTVWTKRPDGFWAGAQFEVRSGSQAGVQGSLFDSSAVGQGGFPEFKVRGKAPILAPGDVVSLTRVDDEALPTHWWFSKDPLPGQLTIDSHDKRPNSTGVRSLALKPLKDKSVEVISYLDGISDRAGKLLPVNGEWRLRFWVKASEPGARLEMRFRRLNGGSDSFFKEAFQPTQNWQMVERTFKATDKGAVGTLEFNISSVGDSGRILLDDIELGPVAKDDVTGFRPEVLSALKRLQPGYLRDWQGQLGDTFDNRLADSFGRRATRYRPEGNGTFSYNLDAFFKLTQAVGAQPWIILPSTLGDAELLKFGRYLAEQINVFHFNEMLVEFGNENWNTVFRPAGIPDFKAHGETVSRAFTQLLAGAAHHPAIRTIVNGQYVYPAAALKMLDGVPNAHALAVAPYFLYKLAKTDDLLAALFNQDNFLTEEMQALQTRGKELMVYEVNLHTTGGDADIALRDMATTGAAAGAALAKRLMSALNVGVKRQCLYQLSQYDAFIDQGANGNGFVKLWGVTRDLGATQRIRPTGLAMSMLNQVLPADIHAVRKVNAGDNKAITLTAFHGKKHWTIAAVSAEPRAQKITVWLPEQKQKLTWHVARLKSSSLFSDNENMENVRVAKESLSSRDGTVEMAIAPYEFVMLTTD